MDAGFGGDADRAILAQEPLRARMLVKSLGVVFVLALLWAGLSEVDEITRGEGKVIPSRQLQVMQSLDGGIVSEILVQEGQVVEAGQILVNIDTTRFDSSVKENRVQYLALLAKAARVRALAEGVPSYRRRRHLQRRLKPFKKRGAPMKPARRRSTPNCQ